MNLTLLYILAAIIFVAILLFHYRNRIFKLKATGPAPGEKEEKTEVGILEVQVYDDNRTMYKETITKGTVDKIKEQYGNLGRGWFEFGKQCFSLRKTVDGEYIPISSYMRATLDCPPEEVYEAYQHDDTEFALDMSSTKGFLAKYGAFLLFAGVAIFFVVILAVELSK